MPPRRAANAAAVRCAARSMRCRSSPSPQECGASIARQARGAPSMTQLPDQCRLFFCLWMTDGAMPAEWRPDRARFVLSVYPSNGFVYGQVDPGSPAAWRRAPYYDRLRAMAKALLDERRHLIMFVGDEATLVMPDRGVAARQDDRAGQFPHRTGLRPQRSDMARDEGCSGADSGRMIPAALFCRSKPDRRDRARFGLAERMGPCDVTCLQLACASFLPRRASLIRR